MRSSGYVWPSALTMALLMSTTALAEMVNYNANLSGAEEVPPVTTEATGDAEVTFDTETKVLKWTVTYEGLSGEPTGGHFHGPADPGANAGVVLPLNEPLASPVVGEATLTDAQAADLQAGKWYLNIHSAANPNGEIRGQVLSGEVAQANPQPSAPPPAPAPAPAAPAPSPNPPAPAAQPAPPASAAAPAEPAPARDPAVQAAPAAPSPAASAGNAPPAATPVPGGVAQPYPVTDTDLLATRIIGAAVYASAADGADRFGDINDVVINPDGKVAAAILGVGGFLGIGEKSVAISYSDLQLVTADDNTERYILNTTREALEAAPAFVARDRVSEAGNADPAPVEPSAGLDRSTMTAVDLAGLSAEEIEGTSVIGPDNERLGEVDEILLTPADGKIDALIIDVGGFLGIGEKPVAVAFEGLSFLRDANNGLYLFLNLTKEQLEAHPAYDAATYEAERDTQRFIVTP